MDMFTFTMVTGCIISLCILGWLYTNLVRNGLMDLNRNYGYIHIFINDFCHCCSNPRLLAIHEIR